MAGISILILLAAGFTLAIHFAAKVRFSRLKQYRAWPQVTPSLIWGHMRILHEAIMAGPPERHIDIVFGEVRKRLGNPPVLFLDLRPASYPTLVVFNHEVAEQISRASEDYQWSLPKSPGMKLFVHLIGPRSILTAEGEQWRTLRKRFNPGFASQHLMTLLPLILDKTWHFMRHLDSYARTLEEFPMGELCVNLTFDIIGAVALDLDFGAQLDRNRQSEIIQLYQSLAEAANETHGRTWPWQWAHNLLRQRYLSKRLDDLLKAFIKEKFEELRSHQRKESRSILALSLQNTVELAPNILAQTCDQLKTFLFAGHDTTSILLQWIFYELSRTPRALAALRKELDDIFGPDPDPAIVRNGLLAHGEEFFNRMPYCNAVIKEALRLYPPAGTARTAPPGSGTMMHLPNGERLCIDGLVVYNSASNIQRDEGVYGPTASEFAPERWLGGASTGGNLDIGGHKEYKIPPSAWRPFERGPRNCIGQELAKIEARVILACSVRRYDFTKVGLGELVLDHSGQPVMDRKGQYKTKSHLFNTRQVTAKPVDGMRMTVSFTPKASTEIL